MRKHYLLFQLFLLLGWLWTASSHALSFHTELTKTMQVHPGSLYNGKMVLHNDKDSSEVVHLSQADYRYNAKGENFFDEPGTALRSNATWIELSSKQIKLLPQETKEVFYTIRVPSLDSLHGSYSSTILIEPESVVFQTAEGEQGSLNLGIKIRYAHQIVTTIGKSKALLKIIDKGLVKQDSGYRFYADVSNCGECYLYPKAILKLFDASGRLINTYESPPTSIMPDNSVRFSLHFGDIELKNITGFLLVDGGENHLFGEKINIKMIAEKIVL